MMWWDMLKDIAPDIRDIVALSVDAAIFLVVYYGYREQKQVVEAIENVWHVQNNRRLKQVIAESDDQQIAYGVVEGIIEPVENAIDSRFIPNLKGVIQKLTVTQHGIRWSHVSRLWLEDEGLVDETVNKVPFHLLGTEGSKILVEPSTIPSDVPKTMLNFSHSEFKDAEQSALSHITDWATGYKPKGVKNSETLLVVGSKVVAMGKLVNERGAVKLLTPDRPAKLMLGTGISKHNVLAAAKSTLSGWRCAVILLALVECCIIGYVAYKIHGKYKKWKTRERIRRERDRNRGESARASQSGARANTEAANQENDQLLCIICRGRDREIMLRDCGHVCLCLECFENLRDSTCPFCRADITGYNHAFIP